MMRTPVLFLFLVLTSIGSQTVSSFVSLSPKRNNGGVEHLLSERGGDNEKGELKDYGGDVASLFGNFRIPASLFAGASAGAAFAMPIGAEEGLRIGLVKRYYALLMIGSLSSQIITIIVSTAAMVTISSSKNRPKTYSVGELVNDSFDLEWTTARLFFNAGLVMFAFAAGLRSWISIVCPVFAKAALGIILSSTLLCFAFMQEMEKSLDTGSTVYSACFRFISLLAKRSLRSPLFALAMSLYFLTCGYIIVQTPHIVHYLTSPK